MSLILGLLGRVAGAFGLSPFAVGAIVAGLVAVGLAGGAGYLVHVGYDWAQSKCETAQLTAENAQLAAQISEKNRQLLAINAMQQRDAERAQTAEDQLRKNQEAIDATPANPAQCFSRDMARRLRDVR
jgi:hypothetical protein